MEEIHVQPKKTPIWPWIILVLVIIAIIWFFVSWNNDSDTVVADNTTAVLPADNSDGWNHINFAAPVLVFSEITDDNVKVRGDSTYGIYTVGEDVFFNTDEATIRREAENILKEIVASINQHYKDGPIRIYGYTDARGTANYNMELAKDRVDAVKDWLTKNGIEAGRISENAIGEVQPLPAGTTPKERQQNRRVEIVAKIK